MRYARVSVHVQLQHVLCAADPAGYLRASPPPAVHRHPHRYDGAGAVWGITRRADVAQLRTYLSSHASEFTHLGAPVDMETTGDVVFDQKFMLNTKHRQVSCTSVTELGLPEQSLLDIFAH